MVQKAGFSLGGLWRWRCACAALIRRNEVGAVGRSRLWSQWQHCPWDEWKLQCSGVKCSGCLDVEMDYSRVEKTELGCS